MNLARISELLEPFLGLPAADRRLTTGDHSLTPHDLDQISIYIDLLLRWNARINLTAIRDPEEIVTRHFGESFFLARRLFPTRASIPARVERTLLSAAESSTSESARPLTVESPSGPAPNAVPGPLAADHRPPTTLDLGSGAGFPGLPLKIWAPEIHLTLIESNHKKVAFLREVVRTLTLTNVNVIAERAETVAARLSHALSFDPSPLNSAHHISAPSNSSRARSRKSGVMMGDSGITPTPVDVRSSVTIQPFDVVTFRAVEHFDQIFPLAARFLAPTGRLAILLGSSQLPSLELLASDANSPFHCSSVPIPQSSARVCVVCGQQS